MKALLRGWLASVLGSAVFMAAPLASADGEPCINDIDCPGAECGGAVCNWDKPQGDKFTCNPAGSQPKGEDGWCTANTDCKCASLGATCITTAPYCTFTKPSDAPAGGGSGAGGSASTAGTTSAAGTTSTAGTGGGATKPPAEEAESGCSVASPASTGGGVALALGLLGVGAAFARRRRS